MTIASVRFYYWPESEALKLSLTQTHWGFAEWFTRRLKPLHPLLDGPEAKGVDIVNFMLYEKPEHAWRLNEWARRGNSFNYDCLLDFKSFIGTEAIDNIERLMAHFSLIASTAPWPQVVAVSEALGAPLSNEDRESLSPFLQWPRDLSRLIGKAPNKAYKRAALGSRLT